MNDPDPRGLSDAQLLRYSRHVLLDDIGIEGQDRFLRSHALVIGAGGLGSPVALYLGSAGVGTLTIVDDDDVDLTNLQRQIAHDLARVGQPKARSAAQSVTALNPEVRVVALQERVAGPRLQELVAAADVVVDCSDNFATRHAINAACVQLGRPLVSGAAIGFDGQIAVYSPLPDAGRQPETAAVGDHANAAWTSPCYACVFPATSEVEEVRCATLGVFAPLVGIIGSMQAAEALKLLAGIGTSLAGRLLMLDARTMQWTAIAVQRDPRCAVCGSGDAGTAPG